MLGVLRVREVVEEGVHKSCRGFDSPAPVIVQAFRDQVNETLLDLVSGEEALQFQRSDFGEVQVLNLHLHCLLEEFWRGAT